MNRFSHSATSIYVLQSDNGHDRYSMVHCVLLVDELSERREETIHKIFGVIPESCANYVNIHEQPLIVVAQSFHHLSEGDVLPHIGNFYSHPFTGFRVRNDNDKTPLNTSDTIPLVAYVFNLNFTLFTFFNWGLRLTTFPFRFYLFCLAFRYRGEHRQPIRLSFIYLAKPKFLFRNLNDVRPIPLFDRCGKQTKQLF